MQSQGKNKSRTMQKEPTAAHHLRFWKTKQINKRHHVEDVLPYHTLQ